MIAELIRLLIAAACFLFVLSLPLYKTQSGATLRRWACVCFILAFLPSLIGGLFYPRPGADSAAATSGGNVLSGLGCIAAIVVAAFIAYGILKLRSRFASTSKPREPWEAFFNRGGGKRPFTMNANRTRGPHAFRDDEDD
jgi:hypothetical protein